MSASTPPRLRPNKQASAPVCAAGPMPRPARRNGIRGPTWPPGPCGSFGMEGSTAGGGVARGGVEGLARRLGYSARQLNRLVTAEVGTGPLAIARAQRAQTARILLETTTLPVAHVAFAAGFSSVRQCNESVQQIFVDTPRGLRNRVTKAAARRRTEGAAAGGSTKQIRSRAPCRRAF